MDNLRLLQPGFMAGIEADATMDIIVCTVGFPPDWDYVSLRALSATLAPHVNCLAIHAGEQSAPKRDFLLSRLSILLPSFDRPAFSN